MAWRHRSRQEKLLLRVIAFLSFVLAAFIIAVIAMDLTYKSEIKKLEDEVHAMKTTPTIISTEVISTLSTTSTSSSGNSTASTEPFTTTSEETTAASSETTSDEATTSSVDNATTPEEMTTTTQESTPPKMSAPAGLLDALRALMTSFSKGSDSYSSSAKGPEYQTDSVRRTKGTFILLADLIHEETPNQVLQGEKDRINSTKETVEIMKLQGPAETTPTAATPVNQTVNTAWTESPPISTLPSITHENARVSSQLLPSATLPDNLDPTVSHSIDSADEEYRRFGTPTPSVK